MNPFSGLLMRNGTPIGAVQGRMSIDVSPSQDEQWSGYFNVPPGAKVEVGATYDLVLGDGRSSKIKIERLNAAAHGQSASFGYA